MFLEIGWEPQIHQYYYCRSPDIRCKCFACKPQNLPTSLTIIKDNCGSEASCPRTQLQSAGGLANISKFQTINQEQSHIYPKIVFSLTVRMNN